MPISSKDASPTIIPVIQEELLITKQWVEKGGVRLVKEVQERMEVIDLPLMAEEIRVERVPVNTPVLKGEVPTVRYEGDTMIVPVVEEIAVVEKRLMLKEELRITKIRQEIHQPQQVVIRSEQVKVTQLDPLAGQDVSIS